MRVFLLAAMLSLGPQVTLAPVTAATPLQHSRELSQWSFPRVSFRMVPTIVLQIGVLGHGTTEVGIMTNDFIQQGRVIIKGTTTIAVGKTSALRAQKEQLEVVDGRIVVLGRIQNIITTMSVLKAAAGVPGTMRVMNTSGTRSMKGTKEAEAGPGREKEPLLQRIEGALGNARISQLSVKLTIERNQHERNLIE